MAENIHAVLGEDGKHWRVSENIEVKDNCRLVLLERRFKDEDLDRWVMLTPTNSAPPTMGGGIARAHVGKGRYEGWAEYDVRASGLRRGIYTVSVTVAECEETGFEGAYPLIAAVPYDFTGLSRPPAAPHSPR